MGDMGELGPIDPSLDIKGGGDGPIVSDLGVEDISSYLKFIKERAGLGDQAALGQAVNTLAKNLSPPLLGRLERVSSHIRLVAHQLLSLHKPPLKQSQIAEIAKALIEDIYVHGHGIGREQAKDLGLDVETAEGALQDKIWELYQRYENPFRLRESRDLTAYFNQSDSYERPGVAVACVESTDRLSAFVGDLYAHRIREFGQQPQININMNLQLPQGINPQQIPQTIQQQIQQILQHGVQQLQQQVQAQLQQQGQVKGFNAQLKGGVWEDLYVAPARAGGAAGAAAPGGAAAAPPADNGEDRD